MSDPIVSTPPSKPVRSKRRRWLFRIIALSLTLGFLPLAEGIMRFFDLGQDVSLVVRLPKMQQRGRSGYTHTINGAADLAYYGQTDLAGPEIRPFRLPKPDGVFRIMVLGASTVIGFPYPPELSFPRHIEAQLNRQTPDTRVEVLNTGITAINSFAIADLVTQCADADPDLIVVHTGHNEFYGPGGPASNAFSLSPSMIRQIYRFRRWRVVQLIASAISGDDPGEEDMMNILPKVLQIPLNGEIYRQAKVNYEENLRRIVSVCSRAEIPVLLTTVACNLKDQSPLFAIPPSLPEAQKTKWDEQIDEATSLILEEDFSSALPLLESALKAAPENATVHYRMGQCLTGLGKTQAAFDSFSLARDFDGCRFRIPSEFDSIVERVAQESEGCSFLNLADAIEAEGYPEAPGYDLFLEHVHYHFGGHYLVGRILSRAIQSTYRQADWDESQAADLSLMEDDLGYIVEDDMAAMSFAILVLQTNPFSTTLDREAHLKSLGSRIGNLLATLPDARKQIFMSLNMDHMSGDLLRVLKSLHRDRGDVGFSGELYRAQKLRKPWVFEVD